MVGLFYKAVPVLADEDKIGGSTIAVGALALLGFQQHCGSRLGYSSNTLAHWPLEFLSA